MKPRILLSVFACDPITGSEPHVGYNWSKMLSEDWDVHIITRKFNQESLESSPLNEKITIHYYDFPFCEGKNHYWKFIKPYYVLWQFLVYFKCFFLNIKYRYKIAHHVTYNNLDVPGFLFLLPKAKFIWGPVGGGQVPPSSLRRVYKDWPKQLKRNRLKNFAKFNPIIRLALRKASFVLFANEETKSRLSHLVSTSKNTLETAIDAKTKLQMFNSDSKKKLLWVGRVEERKALIIALDAINIIRDRSDFELIVVGDGPLLQESEEYCKLHKLDHLVTFKGRIPFTEVDNMFKDAYAFVFTSVQDTSGNVVLEAMNNGLPIIALNHQGCKEICKNDGGILIDVEDYDVVVERYSSAIVTLLDDTSLRNLKGKLAYEEILNRHTWESKKNEINSIYLKILNDERFKAG